MSGLGQTPGGERTMIAFFGKRNAGKSSLVNAVTGQEVSVVSRFEGTTTDPVQKSMELLPLGPVTVVDTPGLDDSGELGSLRVRRALQVMNRADLAVVVLGPRGDADAQEKELMALLDGKGIPFLRVHTRADLLETVPAWSEGQYYVSALTGLHIRELKDTLASMTPEEPARPVVSDLLGPGASLVMVVPLDKAAPKGRLILPQQLTLRDALDAGASVTVTRDTELKETLAGLKRDPDLVVTDSQVFPFAAAAVPKQVKLTSFSILMARRKGTLRSSVEGAAVLRTLRDGDRILISEGCTHHRQCGDIGSQKLPAWIRAYTGAAPRVDLTSGGSFPEDVTPYRLVIHCGGCMLTAREMRYRARLCRDQGVPLTNYGTAIAQMNGILERSLAPLRGKEGL